MSKSHGVTKSFGHAKTATDPAEFEQQFTKASRHIFRTPDLKVLT